MKRNIEFENFNMGRCSKLDYFCYVCGQYMPHKDKWSKDKQPKNYVTEEFKQAYLKYYINQPNEFNEDYTPNNACGSCYANLLHWFHGKRQKDGKL